MQAPELEMIRDIPGYKVILKAVIKNQIQQLVDQLSDHTGEESVILTASLSDGSLDHLGSESGKVFLQDNEDIKSLFLGFCLKRHHVQKQHPSEEQYPNLVKADTRNAITTFLRQGRRQNFPSEDSQALSNQQVASKFHTAEPQSRQQVPSLVTLQLASSQYHPDSQFDIDLVSLSDNLQNRTHGMLHSNRLGKHSRKRGRKRHCNSSPSLSQGHISDTMKLPTDIEPASKVIKIEAPDTGNEIDSLVKSNLEKFRGISENAEERTTTSSHTSTLRALLNNENVVSNGAISTLTFSHVSKAADSQNNSIQGGDGNDIGVSGLADFESNILDNKMNTTGNVSGVNCDTKTSGNVLNVIVHEDNDDNEKDLKSDVKVETVSESEIGAEMDGVEPAQSDNINSHLVESVSTTHSYGLSESGQDGSKAITGSDNIQDNEWFSRDAKPKRNSAEYVKWYRHRLKTDPAKREQFERQKEKKKLENEKYKQKVKLLRQKCEAYNEAMKFKQVVWTRRKRQRKRNNESI